MIQKQKVRRIDPYDGSPLDGGKIYETTIDDKDQIICPRCETAVLPPNSPGSPTTTYSCRCLVVLVWEKVL